MPLPHVPTPQTSSSCQVQHSLTVPHIMTVSVSGFWRTRVRMQICILSLMFLHKEEQKTKALLTYPVISAAYFNDCRIITYISEKEFLKNRNGTSWQWKQQEYYSLYGKLCIYGVYFQNQIDKGCEKNLANQTSSHILSFPTNTIYIGVHYHKNLYMKCQNWKGVSKSYTASLPLEAKISVLYLDRWS